MAEAHPSTVLIADSNRAFAVALSSVLQQSGFISFCAFSAREVEMITAGLCPDIVLVGAFAPDEDPVLVGLKVQKRNHCRVMMLLDPGTKAESRMRAGSFASVKKPVRPAELVQEITRVLATKPAGVKRPFLVRRDAR